MIALLFLLAQAQPRLLPTTDPLPGPAVDCRTGPAERRFGETDWHVFACSDGSLLILARKGNPVFPAMMTVQVRNGQTEVTGPRYVLEQASASAIELRSLKAAAVASLHGEATTAAKKP